MIRVNVPPVRRLMWIQFRVDKILKDKPKDYTDYQPLEYDIASDNIQEPSDSKVPNWNIGFDNFKKGIKKIIDNI